MGRATSSQSSVTKPTVNNAVLAYYPRLRAVIAFVDKHIKDPIDLSVVSRVAGLERKYFSAYFRLKTGVTFTSWLRRVRVDRAMQLMHQGEISITQLAIVSGFGDVRTLERTFKRFVGIAPSTYRASARPPASNVSRRGDARNIFPPS